MSQNNPSENAFMVQGTGSNVGKSMLVAGLCRYFTNQGFKVLPFKPQNMSNNAAVTEDGGEIGRAQALQALACKISPTIHMNPVLLKPEGETGSQLIVHGKKQGSYKAKDFYAIKKNLMPKVLESYRLLQQQADLIIVEGAGSASEVNLRQNDIANMGFALAADIPVLLAADIDRGGVLANIVGTKSLLPDDESNLIKGYIINKFRGDPTLFHPAEKLITEKTSWQSFGICPWFSNAHMLPAEDSQDLNYLTNPANSTRATDSADKIKIAVPILPRIANFDDLDPLRSEKNVILTMVQPGALIPADTDLIILTGSKATIPDLIALYEQGWHIDIASHIRRGGHVLGLCGGYQMLGKTIKDPHNIEGTQSEIEGLGHLDIETILEPEKTLSQTKARHIQSATNLTAFEMHMGKTTGPDCKHPLFELNQNGRHQYEGASCSNKKWNTENQVQGTYLHGLFQSDEFRSAYLRTIKKSHLSQLNYSAIIEQTLDELAEHISTHLNISAIIKSTGIKQP